MMTTMSPSEALRIQIALVLSAFFPFLRHFFFCQETIYRKVAFVFPFLVLKNRLDPLIIRFYRLLSNSQYHVAVGL